MELGEPGILPMKGNTERQTAARVPNETFVA
jgi:hypothetical protein